MLGLVVALCSLSVRAAEPDPRLRAYPDAIPEDTSFETVAAQGFPAMKYPVPIIGWKAHPEEAHVAPCGALVLPRAGGAGGVYLSTLLVADSATGSRPAAGEMPDPDAVETRLVDGYMPGVESSWKMGALTLQQLAFCTLLGTTEARTGRETLLVHVRYTVSNAAQESRTMRLALRFGSALRGQDLKALPPPYPAKLTWETPLVLEPDGSVAACLLTSDVKATFRPLTSAPPNPGAVLVLNREATVKGPDYAIELTRTGEAIRVGDWQSDAGAEVYFESSRIHSTGAILDVIVAAPNGKRSTIGMLTAKGLTTAKAFAPEAYLPPGGHSPAIAWSALKPTIPQGASKLVLHCRYPTATGPADVGSWEPLVYVTRPGVAPMFKYAGAPEENRLEVPLTLPPGESAVVDLVIPYFPVPREKAAALTHLSTDRELAGFREFWRWELNRNAEFIVPEPRIRDAYRACLAYNLILTDRDPQTGLVMPHPDATDYEYVWAGDSGVIIQATDRLRYHAEAADYLGYFLSRQGARKPDGDVTSGEGFFSGDAPPRWMCDDGFILWAMAEHYKLTGDDMWLRLVQPALLKGCDWIIRERARTKKSENGQKPRHYGLLPKGAPTDIGTWDNWYFTDTYSYMGLRGVADVLTEIGSPDARRLASEADDYRECILASIEASLNRSVKPPFVPPSPYRTEAPSWDTLQQTWYPICSPIYMVEAGLLDARDPKTEATEYWIEKFGMYTGLPAFGRGALDPYYVYNQSLTQLLRGETGKFVWTLYSLSAYGMSRTTYATIEGHNLVTGFNGRTWDANRQPHMHSNSRFIDLVRIALVLEEGRELHLLAGTPRGWLAPGQTIKVERAPTYFGEVGVRAVSDADVREVRVSIEPPTRKPARIVLHVRPPQAFGTIRSVAVDGREHRDFDAGQVRLGQLERTTRVVCRF